MGDVKPWHVVVMVAGVLGLVAGIVFTVRSSGPPVTLAKTLVVADIATGDLFEMPLPERGILLPVKNPKTGTQTLFPVDRTAEGTWCIPPQFRGVAASVKDPKPDALKDRQTGEIAVTTPTPTRIALPN